jgi:hypothetical protein
MGMYKLLVKDDRLLVKDDLGVTHAFVFCLGLATETDIQCSLGGEPIAFAAYVIIILLSLNTFFKDLLQI